MNVSDQSFLSIAEFGAVREWLGAVASGHEQTGRFLADTLDQLESLLADLIRRRASLDAEETQTRQDWQRHEGELASQRKALTTLTQDAQRMCQEWERRNEEVKAQRESLISEEARSRQEWEGRYGDLKAQRDAMAAQRDAIASERESLVAERESLAAEREQLRQLLQSAAAAGSTASSSESLQPVLEEIRRGQSALQATLASGTTQAADLREALAQWNASREQWIQQAERIAAAATPAAPHADSADSEQLRSLEQERTVLETELESVRNRAAEMAETLAQQNRQMTEERSRWADELKRMRQTLELFAQRPATHGPVESAAPSVSDSRPTASKGANGGGTSQDPVLDSVMAQFEMLQKDLARRRKAGANVQTA